VVHRVLSVLQAFVAINAIGGGIYGLLGARGVPIEWLEGTPFSSYLVPSVILLVVVGGAHAVASVRTWRMADGAWRVSLVAGSVLMGWIGVQVVMIGYVSWLQPAVGVGAIGNVVLAAVARRFCVR